VPRRGRAAGSRGQPAHARDDDRAPIEEIFENGGRRRFARTTSPIFSPGVVLTAARSNLAAWSSWRAESSRSGAARLPTGGGGGGDHGADRGVRDPRYATGVGWRSRSHVGCPAERGRAGGVQPYLSRFEAVDRGAGLTSGDEGRSTAMLELIDDGKEVLGASIKVIGVGGAGRQRGQPDDPVGLGGWSSSPPTPTPRCWTSP